MTCPVLVEQYQVSCCSYRKTTPQHHDSAGELSRIRALWRDAHCAQREVEAW